MIRIAKKGNGGGAQMDERYPIGTFQHEGEITPDVIADWISQIEDLPRQVREAVDGLPEGGLEMSYRTGGWTARQVVHHLADSHLNAYMRHKLALTENQPVIKPYDEVRWAELSDYTMPVETSLQLLEALHARWVVFLRNLRTEELQRIFIHPDSGEVAIAQSIGVYAWHGRHHVAHVKNVQAKG